MANPKASSAEVDDFLERHNLDQPALERLFGFSSAGRSARRWKKEGAPRYVAVLMAYADTYGTELMEQMAAEIDNVA